MKAHLRTLLNLLSVFLICLALLLFFVYLFYTADLRGTYQALHRETALFTLSLLDERVQALGQGGPPEHATPPEHEMLSEHEMLRELSESVAGYFDLDERVGLLLLDAGTGEVLYPPRAATRGLDDRDVRRILEESDGKQEGELTLPDRFGYAARYSPAGILLFVYSDYAEIFRLRNSLLYIVSGVLGLFAALAFLVFLRLLRRWGRFREALRAAFLPVLRGEEDVPAIVEGTFDRESGGFIGEFNNLAERLRGIAGERGEKLRSLAEQAERLRRALLLHKKYLPPEALHRLEGETRDEVASRRQEIVTLTVEVANYLEPTGRLYPQVVTDELHAFQVQVKSLALKSGGLVNFSKGYLANVVFGIGEHHNGFRNAVEAAGGLIGWVEERNRSDKNVSGSGWTLRAGISRGSAVLGVVGDGYLAMGRPVEDSELMLEQAGYFQVPVVTDDVESLQHAGFTCRLLDHLDRGGRAVTLYQLFLDRREELEQASRLYEHGVKMYYEGRYDMAVLEFRKVVQLLERDAPSEIFLRRCEEKRGSVAK